MGIPVAAMPRKAPKEKASKTVTPKASAAKRAAAKGQPKAACAVDLALPGQQQENTEIVLLSKQDKPATVISPEERYAAARAIKRKLGDIIDADRMRDYVNSENDDIVEYVCQERKRVKEQNQYIQPEFWSTLPTMFGLTPIVWDDLPKLAISSNDDEFVDDAIGDLVVQALGQNPASKKLAVGLIIKRLESGKLALWQIRSLLEISVESPRLHRALSYRLLLATLVHFIEHDMHLAWPDGWEYIKQKMKTVFLDHWHSVHATWGRQVFCEKYEKILMQFLPAEHWKLVETALTTKAQVPVESLNIVLDDMLGGAMYSDEVSELRWDEFIQKGSQLLKNAMDHDFDLTEVTALQTRMRQAGNNMVVQGIDITGHTTIQQKWLGFGVELQVTAVNDYWEVGFYIALSMCAVNSGKARKLPWEDDLLGGEFVPAYPQACYMSDDVIRDIVRSRNTMLEKCEGKTTLTEWVAASKAHQGNLELLNPRWSIDREFLEKYASDAYQVKQRAAMDNILQEEQPDMVGPDIDVESIKQCLNRAIAKLNRFATSRLVLAIGEVAEKEVQWVQSFLKNILAYSAPSANAQQSLSPWRKKVVATVESYVHCIVSTKTMSKELFKGKCVGTVGKSCIQRKFVILMKGSRCENHREGLRQCEPFRMFTWCLAEGDSHKLDELVGEYVAMAKGGGSIFGSIKDGKVEGEGAASSSSEGKMVLHGAVGTASSSSKATKKSAVPLKIAIGVAGKNAKVSEQDRAAALIAKFSKPSLESSF